MKRSILGLAYLEASPELRRFDTLGLPSLSAPPERVRPITQPSFFIKFTKHVPFSSSAKNNRQITNSTFYELTVDLIHQGKSKCESLAN